MAFRAELLLEFCEIRTWYCNIKEA